jgi:hypothetical protein
MVRKTSRANKYYVSFGVRIVIVCLNYSLCKKHI